jgi:hypothetical protein
MCCEGSRADYIAAVDDIIIAARLACDRGAAYMDDLLSGGDPHTTGGRANWDMTVELVERLLRRERQLLQCCQSDIEQHLRRARYDVRRRAS